MAPIPYNKPCIEGREIENVLKSIENGVISGDGPFNKRCARKIERLIKAQKVLLTASGTAALELAAILGNVELHDEIIMPSYTFVSTANAFCLRGAKPVFVDIRPDTLNIDESLIESAITKRTKAIVPVHYAGIASEMDTILSLAHQYGLMVIEDASHGFLSTYKGRSLGTMGHMGCFSFHETKSFICGEGGAVVINRQEHVAQAEFVLEKGTNRKSFLRGETSEYTWVDLGSSFALSDILAAFLYGQIDVHETILAKRKAIFERYEKRLKPLSERGIIGLPFVPEYATINYYLFYILVDNLKTRNGLIKYLKQKGVHSAFHYIPLHQSPYARRVGIDCQLPVTKDSAERLVRLPLYNCLSNKDQERIVDLIYAFFQGMKP